MTAPETTADEARRERAADERHEAMVGIYAPLLRGWPHNPAVGSPPAPRTIHDVAEAVGNALTYGVGATVVVAIVWVAHHLAI